MYGIVRYSFTIIATFCVAVLAGEHSDGTHMQIVATGPRNCGVMTVQTATGDLWCTLKPTGEHEDMMTGFALSDSPGWGRPVGVAVSVEGSLIVTAGGHGTTWRVAYRETAQSTHNPDTGRNLYVARCSACHQAGGEGLPGVMPPLKGSGVVNKEDAEKHIKIVLNGMQGARAGGVVYAAVMPPFAGALSDAEISDIINYERRSWGNHGTPVTAAQVAAERARPK